MIYGLLLTPLITGISCYFLKYKRAIEVVNAVGGGLVLTFFLIIATHVLTIGPIKDGIWYIDGLSIYFLFIIALIGFLVSLYSIAYLNHELDAKEIDMPRFRRYYFLFHTFLCTMILICITNNLGIVWAAIEATTLVSAFLVGFYNKKASIEAAWKYIIICSVGITIALLGTIFLYLTSINAIGEGPESLNWTTILANASSLDPQLMKITFVLIFIGYGTKFGLVPMHTWLPDAHSQAPTPISALLSGVLLNCALYGILRYHIITTKVLGVGFSNTLFLFFGIISLGTATFFIIIAKDYKRLLAYHSIEHMGIISIGFGIGGPIGIFGALFHIMNHSFTKSLLFFGAGNILLKYNTRNIDEVKGIGKIMPATAIFFMLGMFALTGCPPFSIFVSEITILRGMIAIQNYAVEVIFIASLVTIFAGFVTHASAMTFGEPVGFLKEKREEFPRTREASLSQGDNEQNTLFSRGEISQLNLVVMGVLVILIVFFGVAIPGWFNNILTRISSLF